MYWLHVRTVFARISCVISVYTVNGEDLRNVITAISKSRSFRCHAILNIAPLFHSKVHMSFENVFLVYLVVSGFEASCFLYQLDCLCL